MPVSEIKPAAEAKPPANEASRSELDAMALLQGLLQHKWLIALTVAVTIALTFFWTARQPRVYEATCVIEYDPTPPRPLGHGFEDTASRGRYWVNRELFETQNRIIASRSVAEKAVRKLGLHKNPDFLGIPEAERAKFRGVELWEAAAQLQAALTVTRMRDTRIVNISVKANDPARAQLLANAIADAYMDKSMEDRLGATASALDWLGNQLDSLKKELESTELALHDFSEQHTQLSLPLNDQKQIITADIKQFSSSLADARERHIELAARVKSLSESNREDPLQVHATLATKSDAIRTIREEYRKLMTEKASLSVDFGNEHPKVQRIEAREDRLRAQLRHEIDDLIANASSDVAEVRSVETGLSQALAEANEAGLELNLQEITYRRLERERNNAAQLYGSILERTAEADLANAMHVSYVRLVDRALKPYLPISPRLRFNLALGAIAGLVLGVLLASILSRLDRRLQGVEDTEALGITILGVLPAFEADGGGGPRYGRKRRAENAVYAADRDLVVHNLPKSSVAECCRVIRTNLTFMGAERSQEALVVTSSSPREGKTTVALSIAISFAQSGKRVVLVDTDMRKPRLHKALSASSNRGVTSVLVHAHSLADSLQETAIPGLSLLACGPVPPNPSELLHGAEFADLIRQLRTEFDQVIFDSPPLAAVTDAAIVAAQVDGAVLVASARQTTRDSVKSARRQLLDVGATLTGGVLNRVDLSERSYGYGSYYYYNSEGYYGSDEDDSETETPAAGA